MKDRIRSCLSTIPRTGWVCAGLVLLLASAAGAAEVRTAVEHDLGDVTVQITDGKVELSLEQTIEFALRRNLSLVVQRYQRSRSLLGIEENEGIFDFNLNFSTTLSESTSPPSTQLEGVDDLLTQENFLANFNFSQLTAFGGAASLDLDHSRRETNDTFSLVNPTYQVNANVQFNQPLLRNFGREVTHRGIHIAQRNSAISRETFQLQVEGVVQDVANRYWELVEARAQLVVAEESLRLAKELHERNRIQVEVGTKAPLEMVTSEARVATRDEDIIRLQAQVENSEDFLRRLAYLERGALWDAELVPTTDAQIEHRPIEMNEAVETALANRPDVRQLELQNEIRDINARVAENQKKPRLDANARYGYTSLAVEELNFREAYSQIIDGSFDGWRLSLSYAYPIQNRAAKSRSVQADLEVEQGDSEMLDLEQQIFIEVRAAVRAVETSAKQIESAKVSTKLQEKNLDAEEKRFENGLSTSFQVLEVQEDLSEARSRQVTAIINYRKAFVAYERFIGKILERRGITLIDDAEEGDG